MYALAINGSPRRGGNTETMIERILAPLQEADWETELVQFAGKRFLGCIGCYKCQENKDNRCVLEGDLFNEIFARMLYADAIILGSPSYSSTITPDLKAFIDRTGLVAQANDHILRGKIGAAVVVVHRSGATTTFDTINHLFLTSSMLVPGSTYLNMGQSLKLEGVLMDHTGLCNMRNLGLSIDWLARVTRPHQSSFPRLIDIFTPIKREHKD